MIADGRKSYWRALMRSLLLPLVAMLVTGCGLFGEKGRLRDHSDDFLRAASVDPLVLPPGLDSERIEDIYYVPPLAGVSAQTEALEVSRPQPLIAGDFDNMVKMQSLGQEQWVLVRLLPGQVWPRVRDFLIQRRVGVGAEDGDQGVIQSPWISSRQAAFDEIYRFTLTQGVQRNTCEVRIVQAQRTADSAASRRSRELARGQNWPTRSDDVRRERLMVQQFANYLAGRVDINAPVSLMAQGISTANRLYMVPGEQPMIRVNLGPDRAWASLGLALDKAGFQLIDENRAASTYRVVPPAMEESSEKKGNRFLAAFKPSTYRRQEVEQETYRFRLEGAPESNWMQIRLLPVSRGDNGSGAIPVETQQQLLMQVKAFMT